VATYADKKGLSAIAICDHDSVDGITPCQEAAKPFGIEVIPGIELTAEKKDAEIHILGFFLRWREEWLRRKLKEIQASRRERIYKMVEKLKEFHIDLDAEDIFKLAGRGTVGRLHMAQAMLKTGKVKSFKEVFDKYIGFLKPCYVSYTKFSPKEAVEIILKAGGVPVLAHPDVMGNDEHIPELVGYGLRGIEVYHTDHGQGARKRYEKIAERYNLLVTGGSDCHGLGKGKILMGGVRVPYELVERLKREAERV